MMQYAIYVTQATKLYMCITLHYINIMLCGVVCGVVWCVVWCGVVHPHSLTHSPLPLPAPAEGTQGQVSWYKQLLPNVQEGSKGEGPYVCAERNSTSFLERTVASHSYIMTQSPHVHSPSCTHTYTTHTHTHN